MMPGKPIKLIQHKQVTDLYINSNGCLTELEIANRTKISKTSVNKILTNFLQNKTNTQQIQR